MQNEIIQELFTLIKEEFSCDTNVLGDTVKSQINVSQIKDKSQIKDIFCADQLFTT